MSAVFMNMSLLWLSQDIGNSVCFPLVTKLLTRHMMYWKENSSGNQEALVLYKSESRLCNFE